MFFVFFFFGLATLVGLSFGKFKSHSRRPFFRAIASHARAAVTAESKEPICVVFLSIEILASNLSFVAYREVRFITPKYPDDDLLFFGFFILVVVCLFPPVFGMTKLMLEDEEEDDEDDEDDEEDEEDEEDDEDDEEDDNEDVRIFLAILAIPATLIPEEE